jgi:hypothetical protein
MEPEISLPYSQVREATLLNVKLLPQHIFEGNDFYHK